MKTLTTSITYDILNLETGEIQKKMFTEDKIYKKSHKGGWSMIYKDYDEMLVELIRSKKEIERFTHLKHMINPDFQLHLNITKEAEKLGMTRQSLSSFLARMIKVGFLNRTNTGFLSNPYMYIPYKARDTKAHQEMWTKLN